MNINAPEVTDAINRFTSFLESRTTYEQFVDFSNNINKLAENVEKLAYIIEERVEKP
jgi:uncharacterized membrane protein